MTATPQDVQTKLDAAKTALTKTTNSYPAMVKKNGADPTKWPPTSQWYQAFKAISDARAEVGQLVAPAPPKAAFTTTEMKP